MFRDLYRDVKKTSIIIILVLNCVKCSPQKSFYRIENSKKNRYTSRNMHKGFENKTYSWNDFEEEILDYDAYNEGGNTRKKESRYGKNRNNKPRHSDYNTQYTDREKNNGRYSDSGNNRFKKKKQIRLPRGKRPASKTTIKGGRLSKVKPRYKKIIRYKIKKGDTLFKISNKYNVSINEIYRLNKMKNNIIKAGKYIKIPAKGRVKCNVKNIKSNKSRNRKNPAFRWPLRNIKSVKRDGRDGVRSIGIIITGKPGAYVFSSASGKVKKIGRMRGYGRYVVVEHSGRYFTIYANLQNIVVSEGAKIKSGRTIGRINDNRLHFQIDYAGRPKNPIHYLPKKG